MAVFSLPSELTVLPSQAASEGSQVKRSQHHFSRALRSGSKIGALAATEAAAGSDVMALKTSVVETEDGFTLHGEKTYISNAANADVFLVLATRDHRLHSRGISCFLVDRSAPGVSVEEIPVQGIAGASLGRLTLTDVSVGKSSLVGRLNGGGHVFSHAMTQERILLSAFLVGAMRRSLTLSMHHALQRQQFGAPIATNQFVSGRIVDMLRRYATSKLLLDYAIERLQGDIATEADASLTKLQVSEAAVRCQLDAFRIRGGRSLESDGGTCHELIDTLSSLTYSGTSDLQKVIVAGALGPSDMTKHLASKLIDAAGAWSDRTLYSDANQRHTYEDCLRESWRLSALLHEGGVSAGDRVCILAPKSFPMYTSIFATLLLDACYVPIDCATPANRARRIIRDAEPKALVTTRKNLNEASLGRRKSPKQGADEVVISFATGGCVRWEWLQICGGIPCIGTTLLEGHWPAIEHLDPSRAAYILYTSGSTGEPKGVVHTHRSASAFVDWASETLEIDCNDTILQVASPSFDLSVFDIFATVGAGARLVPMHESAALTLAGFCNAVVSAEATILYCVPSALLRNSKGEELSWSKLSQGALRHVVFAGEPINRPALRRLRPYISNVGLHNWYGPTETNVCCFHRITEQDFDSDVSIPIGKACPYAQLSYDWDSPRANGSSAGELLVAGESVMVGYWSRQEESKRAMHEDEQGRRFYRTGDFVRQNSRHELVFLGRRDRQVKVRGHRVQLDEVEITLQKHLPQAELACTLMKRESADPSIVVAVASPDAGEVENQVRAIALECLPLFMVPEEVFAIEDLPRNSRGKIDYAELNSRLSAGRR